MTDLSPGKSSADLFLQTWSDTLGKVLSEIGATPMSCSLLQEPSPDLPPVAESDVWIISALTGALRGEMSLRVPAASAAGLAQIFMGEPAPASDETKPEYREAVLELLRQVGGLVATSVSGTWGEVQLHVDAAAAPPSWPASSTAWIHAGSSPSLLQIEVQLSAALVAALRIEKEKNKENQAQVAAAPSITEPALSALQQGNVKLDLLMDVELGVTLRFGSRSMLLREILDLNPGAVIELDRQVHEPVDMLLNGRVVARGEIVVMDGNYGLRVTEVAPGA